jgi:hypothetical protein
MLAVGGEELKNWRSCQLPFVDLKEYKKCSEIDTKIL